MERNQNAQFQEAPICKRCTSFYANPKFGQFCSKCSEDIEAEKTPVKVPEKVPSQLPETSPNVDLADNKIEEEISQPAEVLQKPLRAEQVSGFIFLFAGIILEQESLGAGLAILRG